MKTAGLVVTGILLSLVSVGCASAPGPAAAPPASVAGEWLGNATVGPTIGCWHGGKRLHYRPRFSRKSQRDGLGNSALGFLRLHVEQFSDQPAHRGVAIWQ